MSLQSITQQLSDAVDALSFAEPVTHVYNPLAYARAPHFEYLERYLAGPKEAVFVGMNPGPWGMAQTGIPFGEIAAARDWMGLDLSGVRRPDPEHPKRPVDGGACKRSEVSGRRLWGWAAERFGTADAFFARFGVLNYCPLSFMEASGRNFIPEKLPKAERTPLFEICDASLRALVEEIGPDLVIGVGAFARKRAAAVCKGLDVRIGQVLHPSPASPAANRGWVPQAEAQLIELGVELP
ncbi:MAG: single-strand selective monofunctional uracil-DNA glycosylase [Proteobacteria bacterium]|nr:single-strand selective monofunctional uracil-DNA glycosylase [Pseudomonadota bacterium]